MIQLFCGSMVDLAALASTDLSMNMVKLIPTLHVQVLSPGICEM